MKPPEWSPHVPSGEMLSDHLSQRECPGPPWGCSGVGAALWPQEGTPSPASPRRPPCRSLCQQRKVLWAHVGQGAPSPQRTCAHSPKSLVQTAKSTSVSLQGRHGAARRDHRSSVRQGCAHTCTRVHTRAHRLSPPHGHRHTGPHPGGALVSGSRRPPCASVSSACGLGADGRGPQGPRTAQDGPVPHEQHWTHMELLFLACHQCKPAEQSQAPSLTPASAFTPRVARVAHAHTAAPQGPTCPSVPQGVKALPGGTHEAATQGAANSEGRPPAAAPAPS